jgi:hypothetical protein
MQAVIRPNKTKLIIKVNRPLRISVGGISAKSTFQPREIKWKIHYAIVTSSIISY